MDIECEGKDIHNKRNKEKNVYVYIYIYTYTCCSIVSCMCMKSFRCESFEVFQLCKRKGGKER
jgi:hypothetical protein